MKRRGARGEGGEVGWSGRGRCGRRQVGVRNRMVRGREVPRERDRLEEASGRSNTRFARGSVAAKATESGQAEIACLGTTGPSVSADADCDKLGVEVPLAVRTFRGGGFPYPTYS